MTVSLRPHHSQLLSPTDLIIQQGAGVGLVVREEGEATHLNRLSGGKAGVGVRVGEAGVEAASCGLGGVRVKKLEEQHLAHFHLCGAGSV